MGVLDSTVTLSGRLVTLRPISREDYPTLFRWRSSFETVHYLNFRRRIATFEEFVRDLEMMLAAGGMLMLVRGKQSGAPIGYALAHTVNAWDGWMSWGVHVDERHRLRGPGGEASLLWVDFLFRTFPIRKLTTEVYEFAERILQMAEGMGFEKVGFIPDHFWWQDRNWGVYHLSLTRERWNEYREDFGEILHIQRRVEELVAFSADGEHAGV
jgi:RimJ/RimL family protein N-acetyltransferase